MSPLKRIALTLLLAALAYGLFFAVQTLRPRELALELPDDILPGDVVLMRSHTWRAELVRVIDGVPYRDGFSHVGLVHEPATGGGWRVIHAVPGATGTVRIEPWESIARGGGISEAAVYRADALTLLQRARLGILQSDAASRAVPFDGSFDHNDDSELYCTELVTDLYTKAGQPVVGASVMDKRAIFPGHLAGSDALRLIASTKDAAQP